jgi:phosphatidylserine decarboxylase
MGAFAEARYPAWHALAADQQFPVKGHSLSAEHILGNTERARPFIGGPVFLVRLAPVDYHLVHYCDDGITLDQARLGRRLWTVNQHARTTEQAGYPFQQRAEHKHSGHSPFRTPRICGDWSVVCWTNCSNAPLDTPFERGQEKSVFRFGGSAIAVFGEQGK